MKNNKASFIYPLCLVLAAFLPGLAGYSSVANSSLKINTSQNTVPRFERSACAVDVPGPEKDKVECGYLVVQENRQKRDSRLIRLPIIILKSNSPTPAPDPVLRTLGGPGASSLRMVRGRKASPWLDHRDQIIFEQRGTRYAQPSLDCPEVDAARFDNTKANLDESTSLLREVAAAKKCRERLMKEGVDLTAYDSTQSAADIDDLRRVLGYQKVNLYGVSYSARLMLEVMRNYPEGVRSVVLESTLPPSVNYDEVGVDAAVRALNVLFRNCAADTQCNRAYPKLEQVFYDLVRRANEKPIPFVIVQTSPGETFTIKLDGNDITTWVLDYLLSGDPEGIADAPSQIFQLAKGNASPLTAYAESKAGPGGFRAWGMRYSVWCREEFPFENRRTIAAQSNRYPQLRGYSIQAPMLAICDVWGVPPAKPVANKPVVSDIPTLIFSGEYDAYTPPSWGQLAAQTLRHSYYYEVPGVGHGPGFSSKCARDMVAAFFDNPSVAPNDACLRAPTLKFTISK